MRKYNPGRPYYRKNEKLDSAIGLIVVSFIAGSMLGATLALMWSNV